MSFLGIGGSPAQPGSVNTDRIEMAVTEYVATFLFNIWNRALKGLVDWIQSPISSTGWFRQ